MFEVVRNTKISFMSHRKVAYALSLLVIVAGLASLAMKGEIGRAHV